MSCGTLKTVDPTRDPNLENYPLDHSRNTQSAKNIGHWLLWLRLEHQRPWPKNACGVFRVSSNLATEEADPMSALSTGLGCRASG